MHLAREFNFFYIAHFLHLNDFSIVFVWLPNFNQNMTAKRKSPPHVNEWDIAIYVIIILGQSLWMYLQHRFGRIHNAQQFRWNRNRNDCHKKIKSHILNVKIKKPDISYECCYDFSLFVVYLCSFCVPSEELIRQ